MSEPEWDGIPFQGNTSGLHWLSLLEAPSMWTVAMWDAEDRVWAFIGSDQHLEPDDVALFHGYIQPCEVPTDEAI